MSASYRVVIPARMASRRLPGKPLVNIAGKPLIQHVYEGALQAAAASVVIATDDAQVRKMCEAFGADVVMTSALHASGSDRIAECATLKGWPDDTTIVNLQGDEPLMPPQCLDQVATLLASDPAAQLASLYWPLTSTQEILDPNIVKVVTALDGVAIFFSRSVIPFPRDCADLQAALDNGCAWKRHIGLYAWRLSALQMFSRQQPAPLEQVEKLEQLRVLEHGGRIIMAQACRYIPAGVDTPEDLERLRDILR
ncbi:MAG: 3-deoxy-manno-octulosonate cytidylyltransferase [Xanthomonadales bacterium]|nr:3-deoxy-manno-octulosonate cytidylyltransferase [Xanthomonadales bacterium]